MNIKFKRFIYFVCSILLIFSISVSCIKPLRVKAASVAVPAAVGAYEAIVFFIELLGASAVAYGLYEIVENPDALQELADSFFGNIEKFTSFDEVGYDPTTGQLTWVGIPIWLTPEQQNKLGLDTPFPTDEQYSEGLKRLYESKKGGGGGGDNGGDNNNKKLPDKKNFTLANMDTDFVAKASAATVASVSSFWDKLFDGEIALEDDSALSRALFGSDTSYYGELESENGMYVARCKTLSVYDTPVSNRTSILYNGSAKTLKNPYGILQGSVLHFYSNNALVKMYGKMYIEKTDGSIEERDISPLSQPNNPGLSSFSGTHSSNFPIFSYGDEHSITAYVNNGDDSGCINKEKRPPAVVDLKDANSKLPSTFSPLSSLPAGKAVNATALKNYVDDMVAIKDNINGDAETQAQTAKKKFEEHIQKNTVDVSDDTEEEEKPAPLPVFPDVDSSGTIGEGLTKDWRLVFPFCIPFDMIATVRSLDATPRAPCFEIPLDIELIDFSYTFVIDLSVFDDIARIFRLGETVLFLIGLMFVTGKVIKW